MPATWYIYYVKKCQHTKPKPKDKFVAIVCKESESMGFLINSEIHPFIQDKPHLSVCQVKIKQAEYKFLNHDSYVDCLDLYPFKDNQLTNPKCSISNKTKAEIKKAAYNSKRIVNRYKGMILSSQ